ncbi:OmpA family protein [Parasphingorhabdus sp.]|uniref:OmpA family protein n=1 Tax=Parasphingorhabdus sp. TaxID=2709688 RepID=UPI00300323C8
MKKKLGKLTMFFGGCAIALPGVALAQGSDLMSLGKAELRGEVESRYQTALAATLSENVLKSTDSQYYWASETKVQCGIALGFLKSGTKDADSIGKCERFALRMVGDPLPPPPPPIDDVQCREQLPMVVFFDWDSAMPPPDASATVALIVGNMTSCGWNAFSVVGHTDASGSDSYNYPLSVQRAQAIASLMQSAGISSSSMTVDGRGESELKIQTLDGERNPTNRRVEINQLPAGR